jgi:hypothetical protein
VAVAYASLATVPRLFYPATVDLDHFSPRNWSPFRLPSTGQNPDHRRESISEAIAFAFGMYRAACESGKEVPVHALARYAALTVKSGACFSGTNRRDITAQHRCTSLATTADTLLPDRKAHWPIPDQVAFRLDWLNFTRYCSRKDRFIMDLLAAGYRRNEVARRLNVSAPRITQRMNQVHSRWQAFQA